MKLKEKLEMKDENLKRLGARMLQSLSRVHGELWDEIEEMLWEFRGDLTSSALRMDSVEKKGVDPVYYGIFLMNHQIVLKLKRPFKLREEAKVYAESYLNRIHTGQYRSKNEH